VSLAKPMQEVIGGPQAPSISRRKSPPNRSDRVVVGMPVRRDEPERHRVIGRTFQLPARKLPVA
jgi:hypothetical protein